MMNAKHRIIFICLSLFFISCKNKDEVNQNSNKFVFIDVIGDSKMDTLLLQKSKSTTEISILNKGKTQKIIKLYPLIKEEFVTTIPPIEMVYIEANCIQTDKKSLRIKVRNTDLQPDSYYIDISLNQKESYITNLGVLNSTDSVYIKSKKVNYKLKDIIDENNGLNILEFTNINL